MFIWSSWQDACRPRSNSSLRSSASQIPARLQYSDTFSSGCAPDMAISLASVGVMERNPPAVAPIIMLVMSRTEQRPACAYRFQARRMN